RPGFDALNKLNALFLFGPHSEFFKSPYVTEERRVLSRLERQAPVIFMDEVPRWREFSSEDIEEMGTWVTPFSKPKGSSFAVVVTTDRMHPSIGENDLLIFSATMK